MRIKLGTLRRIIHETILNEAGLRTGKKEDDLESGIKRSDLQEFARAKEKSILSQIKNEIEKLPDMSLLLESGIFVLSNGANNDKIDPSVRNYLANGSFYLYFNDDKLIKHLQAYSQKKARAAASYQPGKDDNEFEDLLIKFGNEEQAEALARGDKDVVRSVFKSFKEGIEEFMKISIRPNVEKIFKNLGFDKSSGPYRGSSYWTSTMPVKDNPKEKLEFSIYDSGSKGIEIRYDYNIQMKYMFEFKFMRIKFDTLRRFVREAILSEEASSMTQMAYAKTLPTVDAREDKSDEKIFQKVKRFHGKEFGNKAEKVFKMFPQKVYIVPVVVEGRGNRILQGERLRIYEKDDGITLLQDLGLEDDDLNDLRAELVSGATVFLNLNEAIEKGLLPTPWMMIHSVFDQSGIDNIYSKITDQVHGIMLDSGLSNTDIARRATMKSARDLPWSGGKAKDDYAKSILDTEFDLPAELITQSIVSSKGLDFILSADHPIWAARTKPGATPNRQVTGKISKLKADIDALDLRNQFHKATSGKVIAVGTGTSG